MINCSSRADEDIEYAALSYSWGSWDQLTKDEQRSIDDGKTTRANIQQRSQPFDCSELPVTIQDSIILMDRLYIEYIWIDTICIVQDDHEDWQHEAAKMHEVYGNSCFTLCVCSSDNAAEHLFRKREAWSPATKPCRLGDQWLSNYEISLEEIRTQSPISTRAWTLQEERLSPRVLYWSAHKIYWSCSISQYIEMGHIPALGTKSISRPLEDKRVSPDDLTQSSSQKFLISCRKGQRKRLHEEWLNVANSYIRRELSHTEDRFPALSGLASRYYLAQKGDEYIAGLW